MANVKVFADRQTDRQTDRRTGQKLYAPDLSIRGHKKKNRCLIAILHVFSIENAYEPSLTYIINQAITK
jgi:hypothetical protein